MSFGQSMTNDEQDVRTMARWRAGWVDDQSSSGEVEDCAGAGDSSGLLRFTVKKKCRRRTVIQRVYCVVRGLSVDPLRSTDYRSVCGCFFDIKSGSVLVRAGYIQGLKFQETSKNVLVPGTFRERSGEGGS